MKYYIGEKVNVIKKDSPYNGQNVIIFDIHIGFNPVNYSCTATNGKEILLSENEIQSMFQHDMEMLHEWKNIKKI